MPTEVNEGRKGGRGGGGQEERGNKADGQQPMASPSDGRTARRFLYDGGIGQGGWREADGESHPLAIRREGFDMMLLRTLV